jgi:hypothetical protein
MTSRKQSMNWEQLYATIQTVTDSLSLSLNKVVVLPQFEVEFKR